MSGQCPRQVIKQDRLRLTRDGGVGRAHGDGRGRGGAGRGNVLTNGPVGYSTLVGVRTDVSLTESRGRTVGLLQSRTGIVASMSVKRGGTTHSTGSGLTG